MVGYISIVNLGLQRLVGDDPALDVYTDAVVGVMPLLGVGALPNADFPSNRMGSLFLLKEDR